MQPFFINCNNILYEIFYNYSYLWHICHRTFWQDLFHATIYYKVKTKFCVSVCKSACVHVHTQTRRPTGSKLGREILERVFEKTSKRFFLNWSRFFRMILKNIFLNFSTNYSFISRFFAFLHGTWGLKLLNLV